MDPHGKTPKRAPLTEVGGGRRQDPRESQHRQARLGVDLRVTLLRTFAMSARTALTLVMNVSSFSSLGASSPSFSWDFSSVSNGSRRSGIAGSAMAVMAARWGLMTKGAVPERAQSRGGWWRRGEGRKDCSCPRFKTVTTNPPQRSNRPSLEPFLPCSTLDTGWYQKLFKAKSLIIGTNTYFGSFKTTLQKGRKQWI